MKKFTLSFLSIVALVCAANAQVYVSELGGTSTKDGTSWTTAYDKSQLQKAINEAATAVTRQVWVATGTYKPTENLSLSGELIDETPSTVRDQAFILKAGVELYGGFAGSETLITGRSVKAGGGMQHPTVLSGDLNDNGVADNGDAYHVVSSRNDANGAVLDGFTIEGGYADGTAAVLENEAEISQRQGGAISLSGENNAITLRNLEIKNNYATWFGGSVYLETAGDGVSYSFDQVHFTNNKSDKRGGALHLEVLTGLPVLNIDNCVFLNSSGDGTTAGDGGGAIFYNAPAGAAFNLTNSVFDGNTHTEYGGAMRLNGGTVNIISTVFRNGYGQARAGAIYSTASTRVSVSGSKFIQNSSGATAGHCYIFSGNWQIDNTIFENGLSSTSGGAIYLSSTSELTISRSVFSHNHSESSGGALYSAARTVDIGNTKFYSNVADATGGALYFTTAQEEDADVRIWNTVFFDNFSKTASTSAASGGGAIYQTRISQSDPEKHAPVSTIVAVNNTFYANKAANNSAGAYSFNSVADVRFNLYNNIFYQNVRNFDEGTNSGSSSGIRAATSSPQDHRNNLFQGSISSSGQRTVANVYLLSNPEEPLFHSITSEDGGFLFPALKPASPENSFLLDKGDRSFFTDNIVDIIQEKDLAGAKRLDGANVDLGAYEGSVELYDILPIVVQSFSARAIETDVLLSWKVEAEDNMADYAIERSQDGIHFTRIADVAADGSGIYQVWDNKALPGTNFYRLKMVDMDGSSRYYQRIIKVTVALGKRSVNIFPNPIAGNNVKLDLPGVVTGVYQYTIINMGGTAVQKGEVNYNGTPAHLTLNSSVVKGTYLLTIKNGNETINAKLIKQ